MFATIAKNNRLLRTPSPFLAALETLSYGPETDPDWLDKVLQEIENLAMHLGLDKNVKFLGIRDDIPQLLNACDLFVSASAWEGFGIAILEAMLCQRRIVATKTDGAMELLSSNLVDVGQPEAISKMILNVLNNQENIMRYPKANSFDWKFILEKWLNIYQGQVK